MATMASRMQSFQKMLPSIYPQVDHLFIYLDGYTTPPAFINGLDKVTVRHAEDTGDLHASSRFLFLRELGRQVVAAIVDDDIIYPPDYMGRLVGLLEQTHGDALVGVHGRIFMPPHRSYVRDAVPFPFAAALDQPRHVHEVGIGTCAFVSDRLPIDPRVWDRTNMDDIVVAIEAQKRGLPRIIAARQWDWVRPFATNQADSLWVKTMKDDSEHSKRMRILLGLYA